MPRLFHVADAWAALHGAVDSLGIPLAPAFEPGARRYLAELARWSRVARLTGYAGEAARVEHLVMESVAMLPVLPEAAGPLLDIGSGNGAPGVVLKLARPGWSVTLLEANRRRANFLRHVVRELGLEEADVREGRAEALAQDPALRAGFRTATMRAVAAPRDAMRLARPFLSEGGTLVLPLGSRPSPAPAGRRHDVTWQWGTAELSKTRAFLIIRSDEIDRVTVPRETRGGIGPHPGGSQSKGRSR